MRWTRHLPKPIEDLLVRLGAIPSRTDYVLREINKLDLVGKAMAEREKNARRNASESARRAHPELASEWYEAEPVARVFSDRQAFRDIVAAAEADTLHEIALRIAWDSCTDLILDIVKHPACDHATAWAVYHFASPNWYERKAREAGGRPDLSGMDAEVLEILDVIVARFAAADFATRRFPYHEDYPPGNVRDQQRAARDRGEPLHWELPEAAYVPTEDRLHEPRYEMIHDDTLQVNFVDWMAARA